MSVKKKITARQILMVSAIAVAVITSVLGYFFGGLKVVAMLVIIYVLAIIIGEKVRRKVKDRNRFWIMVVCFGSILVGVTLVLLAIGKGFSLLCLNIAYYFFVVGAGLKDE